MYTIAVTILLYFYFYFLYLKNFKIDYLKNNVLLVISLWLSALHVMQCKYNTIQYNQIYFNFHTCQ